MSRGILIFTTSLVILALVCYGATVTYQNHFLKQHLAVLEHDLTVLKSQPATLAFDFPTISVATEDYGVDRGMKADQMQLDRRTSTDIGVPWNVERAMIPTKNGPVR